MDLSSMVFNIRMRFFLDCGVITNILFICLSIYLFSNEPELLSTIFQLLILISVNKPDILSFSKIILLCESVIAYSDYSSSSPVFAVQAIYFHLFPCQYSNQVS